jgi:hypothetical protein
MGQTNVCIVDAESVAAPQPDPPPVSKPHRNPVPKPSTPVPATATVAPGSAAPTQPSASGPEAPTGLRIAVTLDELKAAVPLLAKLPMTTEKVTDGVCYKWTNVSLRGTPNTVFAYDDHGDGRLSALTVCMLLDSSVKDTLMESLMLLSRLISIAGRPSESFDDIQGWITANFSKAGASRKFGSVAVTLNFLKTDEGGVLFVNVEGSGKHQATPGSAPVQAADGRSK